MSERQPIDEETLSKMINLGGIIEDAFNKETRDTAFLLMVVDLSHENMMVNYLSNVRRPSAIRIMQSQLKNLEVEEAKAQ